MIDSDGFRPNVGIILSNPQGRVFWGKRVGQRAWQFPQGGIHPQESAKDALFRELWEETGLESSHVKIVGRTRGWLRYRLPKRLIRRHSRPVCVGQKQVWFLLSLQGDDECFNLGCTAKPEFDGWRWVDYWLPAAEVVSFKRRVYQLALRELAPLHFGTEDIRDLDSARRVS